MTNKKVLLFILGLVAFLVAFELSSKIILLFIIILRRLVFPYASVEVVSNMSIIFPAISYVIGLWLGVKTWIRIYKSKQLNHFLSKNKI